VSSAAGCSEQHCGGSQQDELKRPTATTQTEEGEAAEEPEGQDCGKLDGVETTGLCCDLNVCLQGEGSGGGGDAVG
jgi:hypothetical protein